MLIAKADIDAIKRRHDLAAFIVSSGVPLRRVGKYLMQVPFHADTRSRWSSTRGVESGTVWAAVAPTATPAAVRAARVATSLPSERRGERTSARRTCASVARSRTSCRRRGAAAAAAAALRRWPRRRARSCSRAWSTNGSGARRASRGAGAPGVARLGDACAAGAPGDSSARHLEQRARGVARRKARHGASLSASSPRTRSSASSSAWRAASSFRSSP